MDFVDLDTLGIIVSYVLIENNTGLCVYRSIVRPSMTSDFSIGFSLGGSQIAGFGATNGELSAHATDTGYLWAQGNMPEIC